MTEDYYTPMKGDLLWVYEGLSEYLGEILTPRSGLYTREEFRESLAATAAALDRQSGRTWRPLEDTPIAAQFYTSAREDYSEYRRSVDDYPEGTLIWIEADVLMRPLSGGAKSLNDLCRVFFGGPGGPALKPYTFEDVVSGLNAVQPYDWGHFLNKRLRSGTEHGFNSELAGAVSAGRRVLQGASRRLSRRREVSALERDTSKPDLLSAIPAPLAKP